MTSVEELEKKFICDVKSRSSAELEALIPRLFAEAENQRKKDLEKAFIYYGRGLNIYETLRSRNDRRIPPEVTFIFII